MRSQKKILFLLFLYWSSVCGDVLWATESKDNHFDEYVDDNDENRSEYQTEDEIDQFIKKNACTTADGLEGVCVLYYQCKYHVILTKGEQLLESRKLRARNFKYCKQRKGSQEVCCKLGNDVKSQRPKSKEGHNSQKRLKTQRNTTPKLLENDDIRRTSLKSINVNEMFQINGNKYQRPQKPENYGKKSPNKCIRLDNKKLKGCGYSRHCNVNKKVYSAERYQKTDFTNTAEFGEFPWMVAVLETKSETFMGGGVLIDMSVVLTVRHMFLNDTSQIDSNNEYKYKIRAGEWDLQDGEKPYNFQERFVAKIISHQHYDKTSRLNNVALLILQNPVKPAPHIGVACLGKDLPEPGTQCWATQWTRDPKTDTDPIVLKKIKLPLISKKECEETLRDNTYLGPYYTVHESLFCAGSSSVKDWGSPLVCQIEEQRYVVVGLFSYVVKYFDDEMPGVYVNVPTLIQWIIKQTNKLGF